MNSPMRTMPTPSAQTCPGPRTFRRLMRCGCAWPMTCSVMISAPLLMLDGVLAEQIVHAFPRAQQHALVVVPVDLDRVGDHPEQQQGGQAPRAVGQDIPEIHTLCL